MLNHSCWLLTAPLSSCRRAGGGTALLFKDSFNVRQFAAGEKSSFEFSKYLIDASSFQFRLVIIYRIPYSAVHPITSSTFFLEFSDYLDSLLLSKVPLYISGDFKFHLDVSGDVDLLNLLTCWNRCVLLNMLDHPRIFKDIFWTW